MDKYIVFILSSFVISVGFSFYLILQSAPIYIISISLIPYLIGMYGFTYRNLSMNLHVKDDSQ